MVYVLDQSFEDSVEVSWTRETSAFQGCLIAFKQASKPSNRRIRLPSKVKAMRNRILSRKPRHASKSKSRKLLLKGIRFKDMPHGEDSFLVVIILSRLVVLSMEGIWIESLAI